MLSGFAQGAGDTTTVDGIPFWTSVTSTIARADAANSMMYKVTADTTFKVFNVDAITDTSVNGDGVFISQDTASDEGKAAYILGRVNYITSCKGCRLGMTFKGSLTFASQVGGGDA